MPVVSIILPTYNRADLLPRAIQSVLQQTFGDFELLVIDDGSEDNTEETVAGLRDPRLRYERIAHRGCAAARNRGCELSTGEFLAFIDSDDEWLPTKLERQIAAFRSLGADVGVVRTGGRWIDDIRGELRRSRAGSTAPSWSFVPLLERRVTPAIQSILVRRECYVRVGGFDESLRASIDREWLLRVAKEFAFVTLAERLVIIHRHAGAQISKNVDARIAAQDILLQRYAKEFEARPRAHAQELVRTGGLCLQQGKWRDARARFMRALRVAPGYLPAYFYMATALARQARAGLLGGQVGHSE
jgi:glycosyltransferase involved in cell wall biosynthesis